MNYNQNTDKTVDKWWFWHNWLFGTLFLIISFVLISFYQILNVWSLSQWITSEEGGKGRWGAYINDLVTFIIRFFFCYFLLFSVTSHFLIRFLQDFNQFKLVFSGRNLKKTNKFMEPVAAVLFGTTSSTPEKKLCCIIIRNFW